MSRVKVMPSRLPPSGQAGSRHITPSATHPRLLQLGRWVAALPAIAAIVLIPWTVGIATQLPQLAMAYHWNTAWTGLDVAIGVGLALTSWLNRRRNPRAALIAT